MGTGAAYLGYGEGRTTVWVLAYHASTIEAAQSCRLIELRVTVRVTTNQMAKASSSGITARLAQLSRSLFIQEPPKVLQDADTSLTVRDTTNECSISSILWLTIVGQRRLEPSLSSWSEQRLKSEGPTLLE